VHEDVAELAAFVDRTWRGALTTGNAARRRELAEQPAQAASSSVMLGKNSLYVPSRYTSRPAPTAVARSGHVDDVGVVLRDQAVEVQ
jgi:hypothetical protein